MEDLEEKTKTSRHIKNFYLDPNNYRFVDDKNYTQVADEQALEQRVQLRTRHFIEGKNRAGVKDLLDSFKSNGFLEVDMIQLKDLGQNQYLVLEGNRRVTALKILFEDYHKGLDIGNFEIKVFNAIPSYIHKDGNESNHLIVMGLKHISGNKKWPAINQAKLIYDYLTVYWAKDDYPAEETKLCKSLGISKQKLRLSQRAYHLILQYKISDFGDQFTSDMYSIFEDVTRRTNIKKWIGWEDNNYRAVDQDHLETFFSWISSSESYDSEDDGMEGLSTSPIISKSVEIRDLEKFINDPVALEVMEDTHSVAQALVASGSIEKESYVQSISTLNDSISKLSRLKDLINYEDFEQLESSSKRLANILPLNSSLDIQTDDYSICFEKGKVSHFSSLSIDKYKVFNGFKLDNLKRINVFSGVNNSGKTSLLEAIYLLTQQNNIGAFFELIKLKNKLDKLNVHYLDEYFDQEIAISGIFNDCKTDIRIHKYEAKDIDKKDDYVASYQLSVSVGDDKLESQTHTFKNNPMQRFYERVEILCNSVFKSPYFYNKNEIIRTHNKNEEQKVLDHTSAVHIKVSDFITSFLQRNIDADILDIGLAETKDVRRFLVNSAAFPENTVDITSYGEGLQRIYEIALAFAYCKNGILLIDELETAIHHSLLISFTKFIQELAVTFNVQVFITSHSKECISAFVDNDYNNEDISFFTMVRDKNNTIQSIKYDDKALADELSQGLEVRGW
ncbi:MAG: AAA family ATPase [Mariprofundaceae bacterium]|nr:AAA family ATPase [Mariprofundaceae bacterium]